MISVVLSKPALDKRTTRDRRGRQTDGGGEQNSHQYLLSPKKFIAPEQFESVPMALGETSTYKGQFVYSVTVSDALK